MARSRSQRSSKRRRSPQPSRSPLAARASAPATVQVTIGDRPGHHRRRRGRRQVRGAARRQDLAQMLSARLPALQPRLLDPVRAARRRRHVQVQLQVVALTRRRHVSGFGWNRFEQLDGNIARTVAACVAVAAVGSWSFLVRVLQMFSRILVLITEWLGRDAMQEHGKRSEAWGVATTFPVAQCVGAWNAETAMFSRH